MPAAPKPWEEYAAASSSAPKPWEEYAAAPAATGKRKPPATLDVLASAPYEALAGAADMFYGAPQNLYNLGAAALGTGATAMGYPEFAPEVEAPPTPVRNFLQQQGYIRDLSGMTPGQRVLNTGVQAVTGGLISPAGSGSQLAANAIKSGVGGLAGELTSQATGSPEAGMAVGIALPGVISSRQQGVVSRRDAEQAQNAVKEATLREAQALGFGAPPGNVRPTAVNRAVERVAGKGEINQLFSAKNQSAFDAEARRSLGLAKDAELTPATMDAVRNEAAAKGYAPIRKIGQVPVDNDYLTAMNKIETDFTGPAKSFPEAVPDTVRKIIDQNLVNSFDAADAIGNIRNLRKNASASFRRGDPDTGHAYNAVAKAMEDQVERHLTGMGKPGAQMLSDFREARKRMAISYTLEDALREGTGSIEGRKLAAALNRDEPLTGGLRTAAKFANTFGNVVSNPGSIGTPGVVNNLSQPNLYGMIGTGLGAFFGGVPGGAAGMAVGQYGPQMTRSLAQRYLMSDMAQRNALSPKAGPVRRGMAMDPVLYNYLTGQAVLEQ
jgi:hypothetical protein